MAVPHKCISLSWNCCSSCMRNFRFTCALFLSSILTIVATMPTQNANTTAAPSTTIQSTIALAKPTMIKSTSESLGIAFNNSSIISITTTTTTTPTDINSDEKYEVVDILNETNVNGKGKTGQTTRIYTTGEVDDAFWLKHLGEDFKYAIRLQLGSNERYAELLNSSSNNNKKIHEEVYHEYLPGFELTNLNRSPYIVANKYDKYAVTGDWVDKPGNNELVPNLYAKEKMTEQPKYVYNYESNQDFKSVFPIDGHGINIAHNHLRGNSNKLNPFNTDGKHAVSVSVYMPSKEIDLKSNVLNHDDTESNNAAKMQVSDEAENSEEPVHNSSADYKQSHNMQLRATPFLLPYIMRKPAPDFDPMLLPDQLPFKSTFNYYKRRP